MLALALVALAAPPADLPAGYKLLYSQDFAKPAALDDFQFTDPAAWKHTADGGTPALELVAQSKYTPKHRSPFNIALLKNLRVGDCLIECRCLQTGKEYGHRDMVFVFGFQDPAHFYYTHIATKGDANANNVFVVNDAPRKNFAKETNAGNDWGLNVWHTVRVHRTVADGKIAVYFDDLKTPIMRAEDKTFADGWVGFGSFDDTGKVTDVKVYGPKGEAKAAPKFKD